MSLRDRMPQIALLASLGSVACVLLLAFIMRMSNGESGIGFFMPLFALILGLGIGGFLLSTVKPEGGYTKTSLAAFLVGGAILVAVLAFFFVPTLPRVMF